VTTDQALLKIAAVTAEAVTEALREFCGPQVVPGPAKVLGDDEHPLAQTAVPAVVTRVVYLDGATGGSMIAMPVAAARRLAAAMMGADPPADDAAQLSDIELSAFAEAMNDVMIATAQAVGGLLGQDVEVGAPDTELMTSRAQADEPIADPGDHAARVDFTLADTPCQLVQLVPDTFVTQLTRALDGTLIEHDGGPLKAALCDIPVRVWVELGRASMPLGRLVGLPAGEVVELDRDVDDPVDLYVDGMHVARGRLAVSDAGEFLTLRIESLIHADGALAARAASLPLVDGVAAA
jgi:flagellar motor switch protein FliN/FliY